MYVHDSGEILMLQEGTQLAQKPKMVECTLAHICHLLVEQQRWVQECSQAVDRIFPGEYYHHILHQVTATS